MVALPQLSVFVFSNCPKLDFLHQETQHLPSLFLLFLVFLFAKRNTKNTKNNKIFINSSSLISCACFKI